MKPFKFLPRDHSLGLYGHDNCGWHNSLKLSRLAKKLIVLQKSSDSQAYGSNRRRVYIAIYPMLPDITFKYSTIFIDCAASYTIDGEW